MLSEIRAACCILWVTMMTVYLLFQLRGKVLDLGGGRWGPGRWWTHPSAAPPAPPPGPGDAQPLLLAAGQAQGALFQPVLHLVPDGGAREGVLHDLVQLHLGADAVGPGP